MTERFRSGEGKVSLFKAGVYLIHYGIMKVYIFFTHINISVTNAGYGDFQFTVNDQPSGGSCLLSPQTGIALQDTFKVACANWFDPDSPITYKIGK